MRKLLIFAILITGFYSCDKIEDEYMYDDSISESWESIADKTSDKLIEEFWNSSGYFNYGSNESDLGFQYWPNAHAMDAVIDAYIRTNDAKYSAYFTPWFEGIKVKNGGNYYNEFYDDMEWNALTFLRMYEITKEEKYMTAVNVLWEDIIKAWNEEFAGGGLAWKKDQLYSKNACSNGPASILAARLYQLTKDQKYLDWTLKIYNWQKNTLYDQATGAVFDNIDGRTDVLNRVALTYNQGTFLGTAVELYRITGDVIYLNDAQKIANYTITKCIDASNNVLRDEGNGDGALFKGIFIRYFVDYLSLEEINPLYKNKFENFLINNGKVAWTRGNDNNVLLFGSSWGTVPVGNTQLTSQTSAAMLFEGLVRFSNF
ncbi:glycoside hydrolase family 76 protein [Sphingobacterium hungaricum]|uniref:Glycosyl hydrolase family 76 n=1 Tax=Sphingobacterium hungaricum TaxID=2082723 RepID=A0A928YQ28_9SPHI|nr:glycoside hydrolase family 76 protein [Sphingobacterium hungaricum]MBE8713771.1 glycosyl hydrolase family 76 [Sphingobacterium hungaricum]